VDFESDFRSGTNDMGVIVTPYVIYLLLVITCISCKKESDGIFARVDSKTSGITFSNDLTPDSTRNIIEFRYFYNGGGVAIGDLNGDGLPDIFFTGNMVSNRLYLNRGDFQFEDVTDLAGLHSNVWSTGASIVDINGDGMLDIYVCVSGAPRAEDRANLFYINIGNQNDGRPIFENRATDLGLDDRGYSTHAAFVDYDRDGDLDMYLLTAANSGFYGMDIRKIISDGSEATTDKLFRNNGDGAFTDVSKEHGISIEGFGLGVAITDFNGDEWPDIYVSNDYLSNDLMYFNRGDSAGIHLGFSEEANRYLKHQSHFSMGMDVGDINNDELLDILTLDMLPAHYEGKRMMAGSMNFDRFHMALDRGYAPQHMRNMLQLNMGKDPAGIQHYSEIGQLIGIHETDWSWSGLIADFDNDSDNDIHISNGYAKDITNMDFVAYDMSAAMQIFNSRAKRKAISKIYDELPALARANYLFTNEGDFRFQRSAENAWSGSCSSGVAYGDLDLDGDLDLVVSNIDAPALLLKNQTREKGSPNDGNYLRIRLKGPKGNEAGFGSRVRITSSGVVQVKEQYTFRGFQSTVEDVLHFGMGLDTMTSVVEVTWPDGRLQQFREVKSNQVFVADYSKSSDLKTDAKLCSEDPFVFQDVAAKNKVDFLHKENDYVDFKSQSLILSQISKFGPGMAVGDIDGNGWDDLYIGGAFGQSGRIFMQGDEGIFSSLELRGTEHEDMGSLFLDVDDDSDLDLYIVSGGAALGRGSAEYQDRLFLNDGLGAFTEATDRLPEIRGSGSCVLASDFDRDGDLDLFVGGRISPGQFPLTPQSYLLRNEGGKYVDQTIELCPGLSTLGMVSGGLWTDYDNDGWYDLIVVGDGMPITIFRNEQGKLSQIAKSDLDRTSGWWNSISGIDYDQDGDMDYIIGNQGLNNAYKVSQKHPMTIYAKDFDSNGTIDPVTFFYQQNQEGTLKLFPAHSRDALVAQLPGIRRRFPRYEDYARATLHDIFTDAELSLAQKVQYEVSTSSLLENIGAGKFRLSALPSTVQTSAIFGTICEDIDGDGLTDVLMVGNSYAPNVEAGRQDALVGIVLAGSMHDGLTPINALSSGFIVEGDAKGLTRIATPRGNAFVVSRNDALSSMYLLSNDGTHNTIDLRPDDASMKVLFKNGRSQVFEFYYGQGYYSQSSRKISVPIGASNIQITNFLGDRRSVEF